MTQIALRLPGDLLADVDRHVPSQHPSRSDLIRRAIELYLHRLAAERDVAAYERAPLTDAELSLADDLAGWESTAPW